MPDNASNLPPLIERMLDPALYSHHTLPPIELLQTHISFILLTGQLVYKIKKPVDFGFLNFTTLDRRRHFCTEEVRLNQRGAPGVYLRVEPISRHGVEFRIGDDSNIVEYAVVMKQLPQEGLFSHLLAAGKLTPGNIQKLAEILAAYHARSPRVTRDRKLGDPDSIRQTMQDNYDHTARFVGTLQSNQQFEQTRAFTDSQFLVFRGLMESRLERGFVRECHGDLHLANICLWNDQIILFDCIEFNDPFRCIDVIHDASFVAMDLQAAGRSDLATLFINSYIEQTGDFEGLQLLPLYLCRQAYVRAKVNSLQVDETEIGAADKAKAEQAARAYYQRAWQYAQPREGRIVLVAGVSGSGKSTIARKIAAQLNAIHIRSDAVRKHLAGIAIDQQGGDAIYSSAMTERTYAQLREFGLLLARQGFTVILDAKYDRRALRGAIIDSAAAASIRLDILHCTAPSERLRQRLSTRTGDISDATAELLDRQLREFEGFDSSEQIHVTTADEATLFETILGSLQALPIKRA